MVLGDCEEVVTTHEIDEETDEEIVRVCHYCKCYNFIFCRPQNDILICYLFEEMSLS